MTAEHRAQLEREGYAVVRGLFTADEVAEYREHFMALRGTATAGRSLRTVAAEYREHFMALRGQGAFPRDLVGVDPASNDPPRR